MQKVVIDTNIFISFKKSISGSPSKVMDLIADGKVELCYSPQILKEYEQTLAKPKFKFDVEYQELAIEDIKEIGTLVNHPAPSNIEIRDPDDKIFYDVAKENNAILITGDDDLLVLAEPFIMSPADYLKHIAKDKEYL